MASFAHQHPLGLSASKVQDIVRYQIVKKDDVRRLHRPHRTQCQKIASAWPRTHQGHVPFGLSRTLGQLIKEEARFRYGLDPSRMGKGLPKTPPFRSIGHERFHTAAHRLRCFRPSAEMRRQQCFYSGTDHLRQSWYSACGRDRHHHG